ncbi:MAG TPA: RNA methyltransferase [Acidimicrobiales bacterium]|nr:RNA methyltransferase [Acidimicrobiales bacterium]
MRTGILAGAVPESLYVAVDASGGPGSADASEGVTEGNVVGTDEVVRLAVAAGSRIYELAPGVIGRVASTVTPQPLLAVFPMPDERKVPAGAQLVVVMADVRDPGNAGTVLRTADAAGVGAVVVCGGAVDPYNPKTVRASAGSIFHVPIVLGGDPASVLDALGAAGFRRLGAVVRGGEDYASVDWCVPTALVLGNEAWGLPAGFELDGLVGIPMEGRAESLNVGMACAVLCFEALRQRRSTMPR